MKNSTLLAVLLAAAAACSFAGYAADADDETPAVEKIDCGRMNDFPPITDAQRALTEVPYAKGAPAVVLFECSAENRRIRRIKILTPAGVDEYASWKIPGAGGKIHDRLKARVTLPDGRTIDATDQTHEDVTADGARLLTVTFPEARPGAILDLLYELHEGGGDAFLGDGRLPIVESHVLLPLVPADPKRAFLRYFPIHVPAGHFFTNLPTPAAPGAAVKPLARRVPLFTLRDLPPQFVEPFMPPAADRIPRLWVGWTAYPDLPAEREALGAFRDIARRGDEGAKIYERRRSRETQAFAEQVAGSEKTVRGKAEALRAALARRFAVVCGGGRTQPSADDALSAGRGCGGDVTYLAMTMLRAVGVEAVPIAFHRRDAGLTVPPAEFITPNDVMLRLPGESGPIYWAPAADLPLGVVPYQARGVIGIPYSADDKERPLVLPLPSADERVVSSFTRGTLDAEGALTAETAWTYTGEAAAARRAVLRGLEPKQRVELLERELRAGGTKTAAVIDADVPALDDAAPSLKVVVRWRAEGFARRAGNRFFLPVLATPAIDPAAWAPQGRRNDIDLGAPAVRTDAATITLPQGYVAQLPPPVSLAGPAGKFELDVQSPAAGRIEVKRTLRRDQPLFPAAQWSALRDFHLKAAEAEAALVALEPSAR